MEIEIKLGPAEPALAAQLYSDALLLPPAGAEETIRMKTIYYDDPARSFAARKQTLRLRQENDLTVCTFKTALDGLSRLELECRAPDIRAGAAQLADHPEMPAEAAAALRGGEFLPVCGAEFVRRTRLCRVEGAAFYLCLDQGLLLNGGRSAPLCEIELELAEGDPAVLQGLADKLMQKYGLPLCASSKQQRALALGEVQV